MTQRRQVHHTPIVPATEAGPPAFVVACLDCEWSQDAHGADAGDAVRAVAPSHDRNHHLVARAVDYGSHALYS